VNRIEKVASQIRHNICQIIQKELKDPRIGFITVTGTEVSADLQIAKVYFSVLGSAKQKEDSVNALKNAAGFIRKQLASRLNMRYTPALDFRIDESAEYGQKIDDIFKKINKDNREQSTENRKKSCL